MLLIAASGLSPLSGSAHCASVVPVLVKAIQIFCTDVAWFFSTYTVPFLIGAAWVALCAIPITACVFIYRYGMNLARERGEI